MSGAAAGAGAHAAAVANAIKASGAIIRVEVDDFIRILKKQDAGLVIHSHGGVFSKSHKYMTSYRGFVFFTKSKEALFLKPGTEVIEATTIWMPQ